MKVLRSIAISFSLYSRIPVPIFEWRDDEVRHAISFLPWIGCIIGGLWYIICRFAALDEIPEYCAVLIFTVIPLIVTGGFHIDGFMDVMDAINSYAEREKKLEIMKDPHIGAFSIIGLVSLGFVWLSSLGILWHHTVTIGDYRGIWVAALGFCLIRACCGLTSLTIHKAKKEGMLQMEAGKSSPADLVFLLVEGLITVVFMIAIAPKQGIICAVSALLFSIYYKKMCEKQFGGVTGDTAGFYVVVGETVVIVALAIGIIW